MNKLELIIDRYKEYINNLNCVFKTCRKKWLIIMEKQPDTQTNEERNGIVDPLCAKFRADKLKVLLIVSMDNLVEMPYSVLNPYRLDGLKCDVRYQVGKIVYANKFDTDLNKVSSFGIHYFKTIEPAYYYDRQCPTNYTGEWVCWHNNGQKYIEAHYVDGQMSGLWTMWYYNGNTQLKGNVSCGKRSGKWIYWQMNGRQVCEFNYIDE